MRVLWLPIVLVAVGLGYLVGAWRSERARPDTETTVGPTPSVLLALRDIARLEGAEARIERVIDLREKQSRFAGLIEVEDAILLVASGEVVAGVDLEELKENAISVDRERSRVRVELPPVRVLSQKLDAARTYVHTRRTDALASRRENLETRARQEAERTLVSAALETGLLERAEGSVERTLTSLLRSLGFANVEIVFAPRTNELSPINDFRPR